MQARVTRFLMRIMGSPDPRQIDGIGGGDPLTSKVAVLAPPSGRMRTWITCSCRSSWGRLRVSDAQGCGNILAGVSARRAIERGGGRGTGGRDAGAHPHGHTGEVALARVATPGGAGELRRGMPTIDGVPGRHAAVAADVSAVWRGR